VASGAIHLDGCRDTKKAPQHGAFRFDLAEPDCLIVVLLLIVIVVPRLWHHEHPSLIWDPAPDFEAEAEPCLRCRPR
jgi:hypothetical protein